MSSSTTDNTIEYDKYLASIHSNLVTPDDIIRDIVQEGSGEEILEKHRIIAGEVSEVYRIILINHKELILRIARSPYPNFQQELWAINQVKQVGVLVPTILLVKYLSISGEDCSLCLMEKLDGEPLERGGIKFWELSQTQQELYIREAGEILAKIHSIKTNGFGWIIGEGRPEYETSEPFILEWLNKKMEFYDLAKRQNIDVQTIDKAISIVDDLKEQYREITPCLNHADYSHKHFMVRDNKIVGIIDWGAVRSDSPVYDFACWDYWFGDSIPTKWLKDGYTDKSIFDNSFEDLLHRIQIMKGMEILNWYDHEKYNQNVKDASEKLLSDIKYFD